MWRKRRVRFMAYEDEDEDEDEDWNGGWLFFFGFEEDVVFRSVALQHSLYKKDPKKFTGFWGGLIFSLYFSSIYIQVFQKENITVARRLTQFTFRPTWWEGEREFSRRYGVIIGSYTHNFLSIIIITCATNLFMLVTSW